ncbi:MAG: alpha-L-fucosidase [Bacteroidales bacterium]|nr:alpha-L-fucosidase [Bacteroidales bacterium]
MGKRWALLAGLLLSAAASAQYIPPVEEDVRARLAEWQDLKFGMFIHWGAYSQWGIVESWSICPEDVEWQYKSRRADMGYFEYLKAYEGLKTTFNPVAFDPDKWAAAAEYAGMKYVVFTTKHHDGFCMFDTHQTDYKITDKDCPFHTDPRANVAKELFDAFRGHGIKAGAYFSFPDWHSDDFWWHRFPPKSRRINYNPHTFPEKWAAYQDYIAAQLEELTGGTYGDLMLMWYDMPVTDEGRTVEYDWERFAGIVRGNQPGMIMVGRGLHTIYENYQTPEQKIPEEALDYPWESCITMSNGWSWRKDPRYKSTHTLLAMLVQIISRGGNLLLNVGPSGNGELDPEAYVRLREIGDWMQVNGEGVYGTKAIAPYQYGKVYYTAKDDAVYAFYLADEGESLPSQIDLGAFIPASSKGVSLLGTHRSLKWDRTPEGTVRVRIPKSVQDHLPCGHIWCFKIQLK